MGIWRKCEMKKKLPSIISRTFVMWKSIKRIDIKHDHYSISSNGEIINNYNKLPKYLRDCIAIENDDKIIV